MAKYTELFGEYLKNNTLPDIFDEIENFKSLFILKYIDSEIGFETEYLFTQKLLLYANLYIPEYKMRIEALKNVENTLFNKLQLKTQETMNASYLNGEQTQKQTILPFNADNALFETSVETSPSIYFAPSRSITLAHFILLLL